jgi:FkbM family methyltransferase
MLIYYAIPFHQAALTRFYAHFIQPGDLCFDIGAHVGSRVRIWSQIGARIIALEPQPQCIQLLRRWYGEWPNVVLLEQAVGGAPGSQQLWISRRTPTVSTLTTAWQSRVQQTPGFETVRWDVAVRVAVTTLDALIATYGVPAFCKIDVEGAEREVLDGLSQPLPLLSFEYLPATIDLTVSCIDRLTTLGAYEYNWTISERPWLQSPHWLRPSEIVACLRQLPAHNSAGDVYARRVDNPATP